MDFKTIQAIESDWEDSLFLTFDLDWCSDAALEHTLTLLETFDAPATFFVTHDTPLLEKIRNHTRHELGIHPNFNPLLRGNFEYGNSFESVLEYYLKIAPEACSVRSHSLTQSSLFYGAYQDKGLRFECNQLLPISSGIVAKPYRNWDGTTLILPHFFEDDVYCTDPASQWDVDELLHYPGLKIFGFHPNNLFLNIRDMGLYEQAKPHFQDHAKMKQLVNQQSYGEQNLLTDLLQRALA